MSNKNSTQRIQEIYDRVSGVKEAVGTKTPEPEDPEGSEGEQGKAQSKTDEQSRWRNVEEQARRREAEAKRQEQAACERVEAQRQAAGPRNVSPPIQSVEVFRDRLRSGGEGPAMVVLPPGRFRMGFGWQWLW